MADINGTSGADTIDGTAGADVIHGLGGNDMLNGGDGADIVHGDAGDDTLTTSVGPTDMLHGDDGNDHFMAGRLAYMWGGAGTDTFTLSGSAHQSRIYDFQMGAAGDRLDLAGFVDSWTSWNGIGNPFALGYLTLLQVGDDVFIGYDLDGGGDQTFPFLFLMGVDLLDLEAVNFVGASPIIDRNDTAGADTLTGTAAMEVFHLGAGNDSIDGGRGTDTAVYAGGMAGYRVAFADGAWIVTDIQTGPGDDGVDTLRSIEELRFADGVVHLEPGMAPDGPFNPAAGQPYSISGAIAGSPNGGFATVWSSGSSTGLLIQRYDASGAALGPVIANALGVASVGVPAIHYFSDGGFVLVGQRLSGGTAPIARLFGADGTPRGPAFPVSDGTVQSPYDFNVAVLPDDSFVAAWQSGPDGDHNIFARHYAADGTALGGVLDLGDYGTGQRGFDLVALSGGGFFVVRMLGGAVTGQAYAADGSAIGAAVAFNATATGAYDGVTLDRLADGRLIVAYGEGDAIVGRIFDPVSLALGAEFALSTTDVGPRLPDVAALDDGGFVLAWEANGFAGRYAFAQRFGADAARIGEEIMVAKSPAQTGPSVAALPGGSWAAIWQDYGASSHVSAIVYGPPAADAMAIVNGTPGDDSLSTGTGATLIHALAGNDYISDRWFFDGYADELHGDEGNDQIYAWSGDDRLFGGAGDDILAGGFDADTLDGGDDEDELIDNQAGGDTLRGGGGDDLITVSHPTSASPLGPIGSLTTIEGGTGNDRIELLYSRTGQTAIDAGEGDDYLLLKRFGGTATVTLGAGSDTIELHRDFGGWPFTGIHITDYSAEDRIIGLSEALFYAIGPWDGVANPFGTGQLRLRQSGADTLLERNFLGLGDEWTTILVFDFTDAASLTAARLDGFDPDGAAAPALTLTGTASDESLYGGQGDDVIHGGGGHDILTGNAGNDMLYGGDGDDRLVGGVGTDLLDGGAGNDDFQVTANGVDTVIGGDGDDTLFFRRDDRNFSGYPAVVGVSQVDMGDGNDRLTIHNFAGGIVANAGAGNDTIVTLGYGYLLTLGAGADEVQVSSIANTLTVTDFNPAEDRFSSIRNLFPSSWSHLDDPYATGVIRLVQQGADTAVQINAYPDYPFGQTPILLLGVDARSLNAANFGGYAPDGIWAFGTAANDALAGGAGKDRLSDVMGGSDSLDGGAGNDVLSWSRTSGGSGTSSLAGAAGDDRIDLRGGNASTLVQVDGGADNDDVHLANITGRALITLGSGQDRVTLDALASMLPGTGASVTDFAAGAGGDSLGLTTFLAGWLTGWNGTDNPFATGHVRLAQSGGATLLQFDRDGGGDRWATALVLDNIDAASLAAANLDGWESGTFGNHAPALAAGPGTPSSYQEGGAAIRIAPSATLTDADSADFAGGTLRVTLAGAVADDLVAIRGDGQSGITVSGGTVSYFGIAIGTFSGGAGAQDLVVALNAGATVAALRALVRDITYAGTTDAMASGPRVLTLAVTDGDGGAAQIVGQFEAHAVNDAPTMAGIDGDVAHYVEGAAPIRLDVGGGALIGDADSPDFAGGTLRVAITANGNPLYDMLGVQGAGRLGVYGNSIAFDGYTFAMSEGGWPGSDLVFTFNDRATPEAVGLLIQALTYYNMDDVAPTVATRTVTLTLTDGDGSALGGADTRVATTQIEIAAINEAPQISAPPETTVYYNENGNAAGLFTGVYVGDAEFRAGYGGGSLTLTVSGGAGAIELPTWSSFQAVASGGGFDLFYLSGNDPAVLVGRIAGLGTAAVIVDSFAAAPPNVFSYLASAFTYSEAGDALSPGPRTATLIFNDGGNGNGTGALSASRSQTIEIVPQNDAPLIGGVAGDTIAYILNAAPAPLFAGVTIADPDQPASFSGGLLHLTTGGIGAQLALIGSRFVTQAEGGAEAIVDTLTGLQIGIMSRSPASLSIALTAGATPEALTALARSFGFVAAGDDVSFGTRGVFMTFQDGGNGGAGGELSESVFMIVDVRSDGRTGTSGDDMLIGTAGADVMSGRAGDDVYLVDHAGDVALEAAGQGRDIVYTSVSYDLTGGSEIELISPHDQSGTAALVLIGNGLGQTIYGNAGANFIEGGGGADVLIGLGGSDTYVVDGADDYVAESAGGGDRDTIYARAGYTLAAHQEIEVLSAISQAGSNAIDLTGNALRNEIYGNAGINYLDGDGGGDVMRGFGGDDVYVVDHAADVIYEFAGEGTDIVYARADYELNADAQVELLSAYSQSGAAALALVGNGYGQTIYGNQGANVLDGGGGADLLVGLGGNDVYVVDTQGDYVAESVGGGFDVVYAKASYALAASQEIEILSTSSQAGTAAIDLTGNALANELYGNAGANVLNGGGGADYLMGYGGADSFAFTTALGGGNIDQIADFNAAADTILLDDAIFSVLPAGALSASAFVTGTSAQDSSDRIVYDSATGNLYYDVDGNGAGAMVQFATLVGHPTITASDFTVI